MKKTLQTIGSIGLVFAGGVSFSHNLPLSIALLVSGAAFLAANWFSGASA